ncbi:hypothetical protein D4Q52_19785 [Rhodopseudomonas palustris]|uniref:Uncharacterized protein n=2 Tax=Rhodopseudomonas palustris TaxID=1076 RepID=A0A418V1B5_RHOPL|nr:hypothetical protein D4Q52_19785 [Rhodopseudomonas palustris]
MRFEATTGDHGTADLLARVIALDAVLQHVLQPLLSALSEDVAASVLAAAKRGLELSCCATDPAFAEDVCCRASEHIVLLMGRLEASRAAGGANAVRN